MAKRGPKSAAEIAVENVVVGNFGRRPDPEDGLTAEEEQIWRETVASEAADFFCTAALRGLLKDYCRHRAAAEKISEVLNVFKTDWLKNSEGANRYRDLLRMRASESHAAADKATKLRLTNQSRYTPQAASTASRSAAKGMKPWEL